jgi:hypothetical protein
MEGGQWSERPVRLRASATSVRYSPLLDGSILFLRSDDLYAQHLNLAKARLEGNPRLVVRGVLSFPYFGMAAYCVAANGALAWLPGNGDRSQRCVAQAAVGVKGVVRNYSDSRPSKTLV